MASNTDILLSSNDLLTQNGDLLTGISDAQHIEDTINAFPGWWKENPADGVGAAGFLNSSGSEQELARKIRLQLVSDGYQVGNPSVVTSQAGIMTINPDAVKV